jgi:uncharacterized protein
VRLLRFISVGCIAVLLILLYAYSDSLRLWLSDISMPIRHRMYRNRNIMVPMRDGIKLATDVYRPFTGNGPYPTILIRTTYGGTEFSTVEYFVKNGYVVVLQNVRGRYGSQGQSYSPHRYSRFDGYDTIDWIIRQKWSSGKVGTFGCSYLGEAQIMLAAANHPNHIAMIANGAGGAIGKAKGSYGYFGIYENGVLNLASALGWFTAHGDIGNKATLTPPREDDERKFGAELNGLPVIDLAKRIVPYRTGFEDFVSHELTDKWWEEEGYIDDKDTFSCAALHVNTWYDQTIHDTFRLAEQMVEKAQNPRAKHQCLLIDPGVHCSAGELKEGRIQLGEMEIEYKRIDFQKIYLDWFDYWLKDAKVPLPPRFKYFLINGETWKSATKWPPPETENYKYYLRESGRLDTAKPIANIDSDGKDVADRFTYDPLNPVPTLGGPICCTSSDKAISGAFDQSPINNRADVLIYRSDALESDVDLIGSAKAMLYVSTTAKDTDITLKIADQYPDGKRYNLQDGVVRLRYRNGMEVPRLANPGEIYLVEIELRPIAFRFQAGHRITVYITSSNFPRLARNSNTGENPYTGTATEVAENSVYRNELHTSYIELPLVLQPLQ